MMNPEDYFDGQENEPAPVDKMDRLSALAKEAGELMQEVSDITVALEENKAALDRILRRSIPDIMAELNMDELKMSDGSVISIKNEINASISAANEPAAFKWLEDNQFDGIIKTKLTSEFGKGEAANANKAAELLRNVGFDAEVKRSIHAMTLKSFVKERLEKGDKIPTDVFGVFEFKQAKIKPPKAKK